LDDTRGLSQSSFHVFLNPLVPFVWYGGVVMVLGGLICWWPERRRKIVGVGQGGLVSPWAVSTRSPEVVPVTSEQPQQGEVEVGGQRGTVAAGSAGLTLGLAPTAEIAPVSSEQSLKGGVEA
jgi:hypothetical protein